MNILLTTMSLHDFLTHGRWRNPPPPFVIHHGPHGYVIQPSATTRAAINKEHDAMLRRLCGLRNVWCLPAE